MTVTITACADWFSGYTKTSTKMTMSPMALSLLANAAVPTPLLVTAVRGEKNRGRETFSRGKGLLPRLRNDLLHQTTQLFFFSF